MKSTSNSGILDIIEYQKEQIKDLQNTKDEQFKQLSNMQNLLDQQQRQALQDKKVLEEYKSEINELKALKMPQEDMKDGSSIRGEAQEEIERQKAQLKLSEEERNKAKEKDPVKTESKNENDPRLQLAFKLYIQGATEKDVERQTGINRRTFQRYRNKFNIHRK